MDGMAAFFVEMELVGEPRRRREMVFAIASAVDVLVFCTWDKTFAAELVVSEHMRNGATLSVLKKVLQMEAPDVVANLLRWLLAFCESGPSSLPLPPRKRGARVCAARRA